MRLGITLGDPAGIGPEVTAAAIAALEPELGDVELALFGPSSLLEMLRAKVAPLALRLESTSVDFAGPAGAPSADSGRVALEALNAAVTMAERGELDALVTAPISKHALALAGSHYRGHTELLADRLGTGPTAMAFFGPSLRVVLATTHVPLGEAITTLRPDRIVEVASLFDAALRRLDGRAPKLALCGLNPHAGEQGLLGDEEERLLVPAVERARANGTDLHGPFSADSLFYRTMQGEFDAVVALYHDQGLIPVKLVDFGRSVNTTLGLRVIRTSPDHGTAFELVGTGRARADGMIAAIRLAMRLG